jgi:hypothetical protein
VVTIERNEDRRRYIQEALKGTAYSFHYGLDLTKEYLDCQFVGDLPNEVFERYEMNKEHCWSWTKGQFGAFATEKKLIKDFALQNKNENLVVLLDDIIFANDWKNRLMNAYRELPSDWDALILSTRLGKAERRAFRFVIRLKRKLDYFVKNKKRPIIKKFSRHLDICPGSIHGIFGIIYSPQGLRKLLNEPDKLTKDQDDILLGKLIEKDYLNVFVSYPLIGREGEYDGSWTQKNDFNS